MNHMKEVAEMLGVELEEEFKINDDSTYKFKLTNSGLFFLNYAGVWSICDYKLTQLLNGKHEIIELPKHILTEEEKEYLSNVIKPFRDKVRCIRKSKDEASDNEWVEIVFNTDFCSINFPNFEAETMYRGMELGKEYFLDELGL